jgi:hypothetical protein
MNLSDHDLLKRIRETVFRIGQTPLHAHETVDEAEDQTRASIRRLSRVRVSHLLRQLRAAHGLSYAQVQEQTGLTQQLLYDFEYKERRLTLDELRILAICYGVSVNDVIGIDVE